MDMENNIDTLELGAGQNPVPDDLTEKCYQFEFNATISGLGIVFAENMLQAREKLENNEYDDLIETWGMKIEEITGIEEE